MTSGIVGEVKHVLEVLSKMERYLCVDCQWSGQYVSYDLGSVWDYSIARLEIGKGTEWLGNRTVQL